jgi:hypothetical protein
MADPEYSLEEYHMTKISLVEYIFTPHRYAPAAIPRHCSPTLPLPRRAGGRCMSTHCHWAEGGQQQAQDQEEPA